MLNHITKRLRIADLYDQLIFFVNNFYDNFGSFEKEGPSTFFQFDKNIENRLNNAVTIQAYIYVYNVFILYAYRIQRVHSLFSAQR